MRIRVTPDNMDEALVKAVQTLREGGLVAFPTDTVYGVGALVFNEKAVDRLYLAKVRDPNKAIPVLLSSIRDLHRIAKRVPPAAWQLAGAFWPGALSLVVEKSAHVPDVVTAGGPTVAVRVPDHPLALALIERAGSPLATTSANISGQPASVTADEVEAALGDAVDLILDGGPCPGGVASTVLDLTVTPPRIVRPGPIRWEDLAPLLGL
ncbi:MAG: L-threonylcarbamoyladenylate synthase [Anaerolineae bacterium]|nr:L-threonylcarbamoyladenylate synthase [Anaerolineae bacterium]